jgi:hypothetical protein
VPEPARTVTLPARTWAILAGGAVLLTAIFGTQLYLLFAQRALIDHQESIAERQAAHALPVLRTVEALLGDGAAIRSGARRAGTLADDLQRADLPALTALTLRSLPVLLASVQRTTDTLGRSYVTQRRTLARTGASLEIQRETLAILRESLGVQRRTLAVAERTLTAAEEAAARARSIDEKTGGSAPAGVLGGR